MVAHFDLDSFFASVELLKNPGLKGKPLIVGGHPQRGIVTTCTYEARKFGIHSAMSMKLALKLCPQAIVVPVDYQSYSEYSKKVTAIVAAKAPLFEKASIDEFYIDLSGMDKFIDPVKWTLALRDAIISQTGLPVSVGIGKNKMIAKMATNEAKPNGFLQILPSKELDFLASLSVSKIPGVGKRTAEILHHHQFFLIKDIQNSDVKKFCQLVGEWGADLFEKVTQIQIDEIHPFHESKSISSEHTFNEDTSDKKLVDQTLAELVESVGFSLRHQQKLASCITIKIKYSDFQIETKQTTVSLTKADDEILGTARILFEKLYKKGKAIRLVGVKVSRFSNDQIQTNLFTDTARKNELYKAIDGVKNRFGGESLKRGAGK